jgi:WD40 repeat protein
MGQKLSYPEGADVQLNMGSGDVVMKTPEGQTAEGLQQVQRASLGQAIPAAEIRGFIDMGIAAAPPVSATAATQAKVPSLTARWSYKDKLDSYLLTNNGDAFEAVDAGAKITAQPQPLAENVFGGWDVNHVDNLTDGILLSTDGGVMWDVDQPVTLQVTLDKSYDLERLGLKEWFASSSSKNKLFELGRIQAVASNDGFQKDLRTVVDVTDTEMHGNWGAPSYGPRLYEYPLKGSAKALRITLTPRPGTAIYLAELQLWGNRPGLEIDLATKLARGVPVHQFTTLKCADVNGDKVDEILAASTNGNLYCFASDGKMLWKLDCGAAVNAINTVDFEGNGKPTIIAGCMDAKAVAVDRTGKQLWVFNPPYYKRAGHVRVVFPADLQGNGKQTAILGSENWHYYAVDANGKQVWAYESVHASTAGCAADLDGDGKQEIVAGTEYYWWHGIKPDGTKLWSYVSGPCVNAAAAGDLKGDGKQEAIFGAADTNVHVISPDGQKLFIFNTGDEVTSLQCADVNGDGKQEILVGSLSFNVYCLDGTGKVLWRNDLGNEVRELTIYQSPKGLLVAAGCVDGSLQVLNAADGKRLYQYNGGGSVISAANGKLGGAGESLVVGTADGNLSVLDMK